MNKTKQLITICNKTNLHFKQILKTQHKKYMFMGVQGGGCNGFKYNIYPTNDFDKKDELITIDKDLNMILCSRSLFFFLGTRIFMEETIMNTGLSFDNPNARSSCGCGDTFSC